MTILAIIKETLSKLITTAPSSLSSSSIISTLQQQRINIEAITLFFTTLTVQTLYMKKMNLVSKIYDSMIVHMTEKWYLSVLSQVDDNSVILDVGIGTAGAYSIV